ncbi:PEP/pyruvate-binding domain-containing protein [Patescibacteria group bacterium]|nr:PEP/pyruvate-binding domain-containing protein [Patescibacteria group bacterium]
MPGIEFKQDDGVSQFVFSLDNYESPSSKLQGYQEMTKLGLRSPDPMFVLGHEAFVEYRDHGLTDELAIEIGDVFDVIRKANPTRGAYVGRAVYVPGVDNPKGPRSAAIYEKDEYVRQVLEIWDYAGANGYDQEGCDIALILHPFINVMDRRDYYGRIPVPEKEKLPWTGGYIVPTPVPGRPGLIKIVATFGADEAVQSCPTDTIYYDTERNSRTAMEIALKYRTLIPGIGNEYWPYTVPKEFQLEPALTDRELLDLADQAAKVFATRPNSRLEFIVQEDGVYIREIAPYAPDQDRLLHIVPGEAITGTIVRIETEDDLQKITGSHPIVYFGPGAFRNRASDLFHRVATIPGIERVTALLYGSAETSHPARALIDSHHNVIHVGDRSYWDGERVNISLSEHGDPIIEFLDPYKRAIIDLTDYNLLRNREAGGKAAALAELLYYNIPVPPGFALTSEAIRNLLHDIGLDALIHQLDVVNPDRDRQINRLTRQIQEKITHAPVPPAFIEQLRIALDNHPYTRFAVRSSGPEDGPYSLAGLYDSVVDIPEQSVIEAIRKTLTSYFKPESIRTLRHLGHNPSQMDLGVIVQQYVSDASIGAVIFTSQDEFLIELTEGTPESLVSATATDKIQIKYPRSGTVQQKDIIVTGNPPDVPADSILDIIETVQQIERIFQQFQDVELIITTDGKLLVVQARQMRGASVIH